MSKYSVVMHELAEINLCLRNLDEAPQNTNQSRHANETVHPINTHPTPGSAERGSAGQAGSPQGWAWAARFFTGLPASFVAVDEIIFRNVLWALLKGHRIPGFSTIMEGVHPVAQLRQHFHHPAHSGWLLKGGRGSPAPTSHCRLQGLGEAASGGTGLGMAVGTISLVLEQTAHSGLELGLGEPQRNPENCPWGFTFSFRPHASGSQQGRSSA